MNATMDQAALVLFSGGQDSTTCLAWALLRFSHVETVGFAYGQRHAVELECRPRIRERLIKVMPQVAKRLGPDHMLDLGLIADIGGTALTEETAITMAGNGLPTTFVPGRNLLFFTAAAALAYRRNLSHLVGGMCETDYSGYPDCREATLKALETAINLGMATSLVIDTPLMRIDKAETFAMARELGGDPFLQLIIEDTHSCYRGDRTHRHDWGYGCSECPACGLRSNGYEKFRAEAPHDL